MSKIPTVYNRIVVSISEARMRLSELVNKAAYSGSTIVVTKHGKPVAHIVRARKGK